MNATVEEIASQPDVWRQTLGRLSSATAELPAAGATVALLGCGTSYYIARAVALRRQELGLGVSDAHVASEVSPGRPVDAVVAISRSGTTTEVVRALRAVPAGTPTIAITAVAGTPVTEVAAATIVLDHADERSVVQTRFATSALVLLRAHLGDDLEGPIAQARAAIDEPLPIEPGDFDHFVFLGHGWTIGLADEAALKLREAALAWTESYFAGEYRHGPVSVAGPRTLVWTLGVDDAGLVADIEATGATVVVGADDPIVELVRIQRLGVALAAERGLDPDRPRHLTRSVVLS